MQCLFCYIVSDWVLMPIQIGTLSSNNCKEYVLVIIRKWHSIYICERQLSASLALPYMWEFMKRVCSEHVCEKSTNTISHSLGMLVNLHDHYLGPSAHQSERDFQKAILLIYEGNAVWSCLRVWFGEERWQEANQGLSTHNVPLPQGVFSCKMKVPTQGKQGD